MIAENVDRNIYFSEAIVSLEIYIGVKLTE
jgi:hypothetical protein